MARWALLTSLVLLLSPAAVVAQRGANFSGSWVLERGKAVPPDFPDRIVVQQPLITRIDGFALDVPYYPELHVERWFGSRMETNTYPIGSGGASCCLPPIEHWFVDWAGQRLRMEWDIT